MNRFLDDRCLSNFLATYEARNLKRAADVVGLTQPAMSKSLAHLEADIGTRLFDRKNRGLEPTMAAHELYECAIKIEARTRQTLLRIANIDATLSGTLRIGAGPMWSWLRIPTILHAFMERFPNIEVDLLTAPMTLLVDELENGRIDIAVGEVMGTQIPPGYDEHSFPPVLQWAYVREGHALAGESDVSIQDLVKFPWTGFFNNEVFARSVEDVCVAAGVLPPSIPLRSGSVASIMNLAVLGDYVVILPDDFGPVTAKFGLHRIRSKGLRMWNLETSVVFKRAEYEKGPIGDLIEMMKEKTPDV